jgi:hypothetical protein
MELGSLFERRDVVLFFFSSGYLDYLWTWTAFCMTYHGLAFFLRRRNGLMDGRMDGICSFSSSQEALDDALYHYVDMECGRFLIDGIRFAAHAIHE